MTFMSHDGKCDNCGTEVEEEAVGTGDHEFCSERCQEEYQEAHSHEEEEEEEAQVCQFC